MDEERGAAQRALFRRWPAGVSVVVAEVEGRRYCLDDHLAATSAELTDLLCVTIGIDGPPLPATDLGGLLD